MTQAVSIRILLAVAWLGAVTAPAAALQLQRTAFSGGALAASGGSFTLGATLAEAGVVGRVSGGSYTLSEGFWANVLAITATDASPDLADPAPPAVHGLRPSFPNPFGTATSIAYAVAARSSARLTIYDVAGRRIATIVDGPHEPGRYEVRWNGVDDAGTAVASGVYLVRLDVGSWSQTRKMLKIR